MTYVIISIVVAYISYRLFSKTGVDMNIRGINMISWIYYVQLVLMSLIGSTLVVTGDTSHYIISSIPENMWRIKLLGWCSVLYVMLVFPLAVIIVRIICRYRRCSNGIRKIIIKNQEARKFMICYPLKYALFLIAILASMYTLYISGYIGIIQMVLGNASPIIGTSFSRAFSGNEYIKNIFAFTLTELLSYVFYVSYMLKHKLNDMFCFILLFLFTAMLLTQGYSKAPIINYGISFVMLNILLYGRISKKKCLFYCLLGCGGIIVMYKLTSNLLTTMLFQNYYSGIFGRILMSQIAGLFKTLQYFPLEHGFLGISSFSNAICKILNMPYSSRSARIIMELFNPEGVVQGAAGVMNSIFIAESWANWGWVGIFVSPWIVGIVTGMIYYSITSKNDEFSPAVYAYLALRIPITGGVNDFIYPVGLIIPIIFIILIRNNAFKR